VNFKISNIEHYSSRYDLNVDEILKTYGTSLADMKKAMIDAIFTRRNNIPVTKDLAKYLKDLLERFFATRGAKLYQCGYSPTMRENPDVAIGQTDQTKKIFIEIEFRPNVHKDIVKFLIGHKKQVLELGILIVAMNRKAINKGYHTMPEYKKCVQTIRELQSDCPMLVLGIDGRWIQA